MMIGVRFMSYVIFVVAVSAGANSNMLLRHLILLLLMMSQLSMLLLFCHCCGTYEIFSFDTFITILNFVTGALKIGQ